MAPSNLPYRAASPQETSLPKPAPTETPGRVCAVGVPRATVSVTVRLFRDSGEPKPLFNTSSGSTSEPTHYNFRRN